MGKVFAGQTFCVSGSFTVSQNEMRELVINNGGHIATTPNKSCTYLVADSMGSSKTMKAAKDGLDVVTEAWVRASIKAGKLSTDKSLFLSGGGGGGASSAAADDDDDEEEDAPKKKAPARKRAAKKAASEDDEEEEEEAPKKKGKAAAAKPAAAKKGGAGGAVFAGETFCVSGSFTVSQGAMKKLVTDNGGKIADTPNKNCTYLVADSLGSAKTVKAQKDGIDIVTEDWINDSISKGKKSTNKSHFLSGGGAEGGDDDGDADMAEKDGEEEVDDDEDLPEADSEDTPLGVFEADFDFMLAQKMSAHFFLALSDEWMNSKDKVESRSAGAMSANASDQEAESDTEPLRDLAQLRDCWTGTSRRVWPKWIAQAKAKWTAWRQQADGEEGSKGDEAEKPAAAEPITGKRKADGDNLAEDEAKAKKAKPAAAAVKVKGPVFAGLNFVCSGKFSISQGAMESLLKKHGGAVNASLTQKTTHVLSEIYHDDPKGTNEKTIRGAKLGMQLVDSAWVNKCIASNSLEPETFDNSANRDDEEEIVCDNEDCGGVMEKAAKQLATTFVMECPLCSSVQKFVKQGRFARM